MTKIKLVSCLLFYAAISSTSIAQNFNHKKPVFIAFEQPEEVSYRELSFQVDEIIDSTNTNGIYGFIVTGFQSTMKPVKFKNGIENQFRNFISNYSFHNPLGKKIKLVIKDLQVSQKIDLKRDPGMIIMALNYYYDNQLIHSDLMTKTHKKGSHQTKVYTAFLEDALGKSLENLNTKILNQ